MKSTDEAAFTALIAQTWRFYGKTPTGEDVAAWFDLLVALPLDQVTTAFRRHLTDPERGQYLPKPADIVRHLPTTATDDGRPGPDEAWGLLVRLIRDERETGVLTDEMREGWAVCQPILDLGDEVGARMAFRETYARQVQTARQRGLRARWTVTLGTDPAGRLGALQAAVTARRISADHARGLLPGPAPASLDQVAGLLEGPDSTRKDADTAQRLRALAEMLRAGSAEAEASRERERQEQRDREAEQKQRVRELLEPHPQPRDSGQEAA